ncbi:pre-toxin TG domain-containing protein, partial [Bacillus subtilis]
MFKQNKKTIIICLVAALCVVLGAGANAAAAPKEKQPEPSLLEIAARVRQYANCDELPLLERPECLKEFAVKSLKVSAATVLFLYLTRESMKDDGTSFDRLNKQLAGLRKLHPEDLLDPSKETDPEKQKKMLEQTVKVFNEANPLLESLRQDLVKASRMFGDKNDSLGALAVLTVTVGDHYPLRKPVKHEPVKTRTIFDDFDDIMESINQINKGLAQMNSGLAQMNAAVDDVNSGLGQMNKGIAQANKGMTQLNTGITEANKGLAQMNKAVPGIGKGADLLKGLPVLGEFDFLAGLKEFTDGRPAEDDRVAKALTSALLDLVPGLGDGKGIVEAITGKSTITDQKLGVTERLLGAVVLFRWL